MIDESSPAGSAAPVSIPATEVHAMHSPEIGGDFEIWVARPVAGARGLPKGPVGVLYLLDANLYFGTATEMTRLMHQLFGELPPLLVVGVAYPTDDPTLQGELRARDFTPTSDAGFAAMARNIPGAREPSLAEGERLGKGPSFLAFLRDRVRPFVEDRFEVAPANSVLWGSSLGGLFTLYAALSAPTSFDAFLATSPAIWWDDGFLLRLEEEVAAGEGLPATRIVLSVGADEERADIPMLARFRMVTNVESMADRLSARSYPGLEITRHVLEGESHTSVVAPALSRSLRAVFGPGSVGSPGRRSS